MLLFVLLALGHATQGLPNVDDVTIPPWVTTTTWTYSYLDPLSPLCGQTSTFINGNFSIVGYMEVDMEVLKPTSNITLHISDIITKNDTVKTEASRSLGPVDLDVQLPRSIKPLHYVVKLQPFINGNFSIVGYMEVEMEVSDQATSRGLRIKKHEYDHSRHFYIAHLRKELQKGKRYILSMEFLGYLNNKLHGFYRATYKDVYGNIRNAAATQFQPTAARKAFPCFDEPALKATFEISPRKGILDDDPLQHAHCRNGACEGWMWDRYEKSVPMSTYLVAFVVSDYVHINSTENDRVDFRVWARQETIDQAEYANEIGPKILCFFEDYFNLSYPLPKMDMIALTDLSFGGMENWGLITFRESFLLYDPQVSTPADKAVIANILSHELAHQWFGNLVTPKWWDDLWLNEGFATYISYLGVDHVEPTWKAMEEIVFEIVHRVFNLDSLESSHRINIPASNPDEIFEVFDDISYNKGRDCEDDHGHVDAADGIPRREGDKEPRRNLCYFDQERFLLEGSANSSSTTDYKWWVPLTFTTQSEANFSQTQASLWMKDSEDHVTVSSLPPKDQWVISTCSRRPTTESTTTTTTGILSSSS
ncbi:putative aminopeptidase N-like isoformX1 [Penaeus vannamei]|uniref:Putative aminopeptidase N-like isoformX1 n=1 Tax=Penaeus vannamei TaxID=6689 RepID=A0A3R7NX03_PENVA|nr:putative aminopeptidase N-like isoformX1 [Penaeus vannamei]